MSINNEASELEEHEWIQLPPGRFPGIKNGPKRTRNPYYVEDGVAHVQLHNKDGSVAGEFLIDEADIDKVILYGKWHRQRGKGDYIESSGSHRVKLHRLLMDFSPLETDHINRDKADNRRSNLRLCERYENLLNVGPRKGHKYKGGHSYPIGWNRKKEACWLVTIGYRGKSKFLGYCSSEEDAARMYDRAAIELHGEFACTNFPRSDYEKESL